MAFIYDRPERVLNVAENLIHYGPQNALAQSHSRDSSHAIDEFIKYTVLLFGANLKLAALRSAVPVFYSSAVMSGISRAILKYSPYTCCVLCQESTQSQQN